MQTYELESKLSPEHRAVDRYERHYNDITTLAAEMLDGRMQTTFEYSFDGEELYASDNSALGEIFETAQKESYGIAANDPRLTCEIRRRGYELDEYYEMVAMAKGDGPNTMVVVSDPPKELDEWGEDVGGYNFKRRTTMLRVITRLPSGKLSVTSQSLDRSDRDGLENIYRFFDQEPKPGELLPQRIKINSDRQGSLVDELTQEYDRTMETKFGGRYLAGRTPGEGDNTYEFVCGQDDLLREFMQLSQSDETLLGLVAALENRWNKYKSGGDLKSKFVELSGGLSAYSEIQFMAEMAAGQGKTYSGCGMTISGKNEMEALGYGNKAEEKSDQDCEFISKKCPECGAKNVKTVVTKSQISGSCGCVKHK